MCLNNKFVAGLIGLVPARGGSRICERGGDHGERAELKAFLAIFI